MCIKIFYIHWDIFVLLALTTIKSEDIPEITLLSKKNGYDNKYRMTCVVGGNSTDSAIIWNEPFLYVDYGVMNFVSEYVPRRNNLYDCDIGVQGAYCNNYWTEKNVWLLEDSFFGRLGPVTDRRWEEFEVYHTNKSSNSKTIAVITESNFKVHVSIRIKEQAHIYLCDNQSRANCYCIFLESRKGESNGIKLCSHVTIPKTEKEDCLTLTSGTRRDSYYPILNEMEWRHFTIEKDAHAILVWLIGETVPILNYTNVQTILFNAPYLSIKSNETPGLWKLHAYSYTFTKRERTTIFGPRMEIKQNNFCMTFFVAMCHRCILKLEVLNLNYSPQEIEIIKTVVIKPIQGMVWQEEKLVMTLPYTPIVIQLRVHSVCSKGKCDRAFWAIDKFQICSEKEIRILSSSVQDRENAWCQLIKYPQWHLKQTEVQPHSLPDKNCIGETFSKSCTQCSIVSGCDNRVICELQVKGQSVCRCTTGYTGPECKTSLRKVEQLSITSVTNTTITIQWEPPQGITQQDKITHYNIRYKHMKFVACGTEPNQNGDSIQTVRVSNTTVTIKDLRPYSEYLIEVSAFSDINGIPSTITAYTLQTDSLEDSEKPIVKTVEPGIFTVKITLQQPNCTLIKGPIAYSITSQCSNSWCLQDAEDITYIENDGPIILSHLQAFSNYTVNIKVRRKMGYIYNGYVITEMFHTNVSVPNEVTNLTVYSKTTSSVSLRFLPPYPPNGEVERYYIGYYYTTSASYRSPYKFERFQPTECRLWRNFSCVTLQKLEPNKLYGIGVLAKNVGTAYNTGTAIYATTEEGKPEFVENLTAKWDNYYNLTLTWEHPSVTNGPLIKFIVNITSERNTCYNKSIPINEENYNSTYYCVIPFETCYSSNLSIHVVAFNIYKGLPGIQKVLSPPKGPSFNKTPSVKSITNTTITINLPPPKDIANNSVMYVIVSNANSPSEVANNISQIWKKTDVPNSMYTWIAAEYDFTKVEAVLQMLVIGNGNTSHSTRLNKELHNQILHTATKYTIFTAIINVFGGFERYTLFTIEGSTSNEIQSEKQLQVSNYGLFALLLLLIVPVIVWIFIRKRKEYNFTWFPTFYRNRNLECNTDTIHLTKIEEKTPGKLATPFELRLKRKNKIDEDADLLQPSPSTNNTNKEFSKPVKLIEFEKYIKESIENGELQRQHQLLPQGQTKPWDYGMLPQNKSKNRYNNLVAYDCTRVKLTKINNDPYSDYINANYIEGYHTKKTYIAAQGPKATTVNDFWRMIWQENVKHIVMLAKVIEGGKNKTEQYWPNIHEYLEFGDIKVEYVSSRVFEDYEVRTFLVSSKAVERRVEHLHFTSWPDHGVPLYSHSLVPFVRKLLTIPQGTSPIVVHCSAGVGRTGTIILCDLCLRMAGREGVVDALKHLYNLREQRVNLVDNTEQYKLAHLVLLECLVTPQTNISCDEEMEGAILRLLESERVAQQMLCVHETAWQDQVMRPPLESTPNPEWSTKNRFQDITPWGYGRVKLSQYTVTDEDSDYINAVQVDGFRSPQRFIVTQQPLPYTKSDFWRMIDEKEVTTIVSLNEINVEDETSCVFWPTETDNEIQPTPFLTLEFQNNANAEHYSIVTMYLCKKQESTKRIVKLIMLKGWSAKKVIPDEEESLIKLWVETQRVSATSSPIVVTCYDGAKASGLFIALSIVIEKMKFEQECDVCSAVRTIRHNRTQFVGEVDQFLFLYRAAVRYLRFFDLYTNINSIA